MEQPTWKMDCTGNPCSRGSNVDFEVGHMGKRHYVGQFEDCELAAIMIDRKCIELGIPPRNDTIPTPESLVSIGFKKQS